MNWRNVLTPWRHAGTDEAKAELEQSRQQRLEVERLAGDLRRRGSTNHFAEDLGKAFRGDKEWPDNGNTSR
jgi:hypothetical protein